MMTASSSNDELNLSLISFNTDAAATAVTTTTTVEECPSSVTDDESYHAASTVIVTQNFKEVTILDRAPPPPPHIELLNLNTEAIVKRCIDNRKHATSQASRSDDHCGSSDACVTCISLVVSYLDDDGRESARVSCVYLRKAVEQYYKYKLYANLSNAGRDENEDNEHALVSLQHLLLLQQQQQQQLRNHKHLIDDTHEIITPSSRERSMMQFVEGNNIQLTSYDPTRHSLTPTSLSTQVPPQLLHSEKQLIATPTQSPNDIFKLASESQSSSFKTESLDDSTLLSYPQETMMEEDDEESWELNPAAQTCGREHTTNITSLSRKNDTNVKIIEPRKDAKIKEEKKEEEVVMLDTGNTCNAPDILAQFSDAMLYGDAPPVLSQLMSGIVDTAKHAVSQLYHPYPHQYIQRGDIFQRNKNQDDGVDDAGPIKIGTKYYSHNEALRRWRRAKVKLEDRYHGIDTDGNVKMEQTTFFDKSSLFQDRDARGEKIYTRNFWNGDVGIENGEEVDKEEKKFISNQEINDGNIGTSMSIDHLVTTYAMLKKEAKISSPSVSHNHDDDYKEDDEDEDDTQADKDNEEYHSKPNNSGVGDDCRTTESDDVTEGDTASFSSSSSWGSLPTTSPPPPPPSEEQEQAPLFLKGDSYTDSLGDELSIPTDISRMSAPGVAYKFIGGGVRRDCDQSVLGSQYGMEVLYNMPKKTVVERKPRTLASHSFGVGKVTAKHSAVTKKRHSVRDNNKGGEPSGFVAGAKGVATTKTTKQSELEKYKSSSWTNRKKSNPPNSTKILPLNLKLGRMRPIKS